MRLTMDVVQIVVPLAVCAVLIGVLAIWRLGRAFEPVPTTR